MGIVWNCSSNNMFVLFIFLNIICAITSDCPIGWLNGGTYCYHFSVERLTWGAAQEYCWSLGGHLAEFANLEEEKDIEAFLSKDDADAYWIGLTDLGQEGTWRWEESHQTPSYTNWYGDDPNGGNRENCVLKWPGHGWQWYDHDCQEDEWPNHAL